MLPMLGDCLGRPKAIKLVIDANVIISDIRWLVKKRRKPGARTSLQEVVASQTVVAFAPLFLETEVRKELAAVASEENISLDAMLAEWMVYRQHIRFFETPSPSPSDAMSSDIADPKDAPYVETYIALGAAAIITADTDFKRMRARTVQVELTTTMRSYSRSASIEFSIKFLGLFATTLSGALVLQLVMTLRWLVRAFIRMPRPVQALVIAALLAALPDRQTRARLIGLLAHGWRRVVETLKEIAPGLIRLSVEAEDAGKAARAAWAAVDTIASPRRVPIRTHVLAACVAAGTPLAQDEIRRELEGIGVKTSAPSFNKYLRHVLRTHGALVQAANGKWALRQSRGYD
jgi:predicted nucleic acid-binding protein